LFIAPTISTCAPRAAKAMAVALPIPLVEPVTRAVLPLRSVMRCVVLSLQNGWCDSL
jgi:hypothetical protein